MNIQEKTLEQLENDTWSEPTSESHLVTTCHRLRKVSLGEYDVEDFRIMIGQNIGLPYLIPLALDILNDNPLAEGDYYPGDLLKSVLTVDGEFWQANQVVYERCIQLIESTIARFKSKWQVRIQKAKAEFGAVMDDESVAESEEWDAYLLCENFGGIG